jgi:hypothetical protein
LFPNQRQLFKRTIQKGDNSQNCHRLFVSPSLRILARNDATYSLLPQQGQHALWQLVGLRHHGGTGLLQDLRA